MPRSKSSQRWLKEHFQDVYVKQAQKDGYRSRAVYKLKEIDEKEHLLTSGMTIIDLGAAPGGWSQYASEKLKGRGTIIALDILPFDPIPNVHQIIGDFSSDAVLNQLVASIPTDKVDLVLSDIAPNMSGNASVDIPKAMYLVELAVDFALQWLNTGGALLVKIFHGEGFDELVRLVRTRFQRVVVRKPQASRSRSRETYLLAKGFDL